MTDPIHFGSDKNRQRYEKLTPAQKAAFERSRAKTRTAEARAEEHRIRELAEQEFPPAKRSAARADAAALDEKLLDLLATLRAERERQGLSLADVVERTGLNLSTVSRLELGKVPNPTYGTLRAYAEALGMSLEIAAVKP